MEKEGMVNAFTASPQQTEVIKAIVALLQASFQPNEAACVLPIIAIILSESVSPEGRSHFLNFISNAVIKGKQEFISSIEVNGRYGFSEESPS